MGDGTSEMKAGSSFDDVITFWFEETTSKRRFAADPSFDAEVAGRFNAVLEAAERCELYPWRSEPEGRLAEIIVLDQFSRNIRRGGAGAFANDALALALAQEAIAGGADAALPAARAAFVYMPFMHSESAVIQALSVALFTARGLEDNISFAHRHKDIIDRFGRFPHRNAALGRASTEDEVTFLQTAGSRF